MKLIDILSDKTIKRIEARTMIINGILNGKHTIENIMAVSKGLKENKVLQSSKQLKRYPTRG